MSHLPPVNPYTLEHLCKCGKILNKTQLLAHKCKFWPPFIPLFRESMDTHLGKYKAGKL